MWVAEPSRLSRLKDLVERNPKFAFTFLCYSLVLIIYVNLTTFNSVALGVPASIFYSAINIVFLSSFFPEKELALRLTSGMLIFVSILGFLGWLAIIIHNLDVPSLATVLFFTATLASLANKKMGKRDVAY